MSSSSWRPGAELATLRLRAELLARVRAFFAARGVLEVETPALSAAAITDPHLASFGTLYTGPGPLNGQTLYLHTSPEFTAKKLLAAGESRIFDFARVYRNREQGPLHANEFTLLEWYRAEAPYEQLMDDCVQLMRLAAETTGQRRFSWKGRNVDPFEEPERLTVSDAFRRYAGIDLAATLTDDPAAPDRRALASMAQARGFRVGDDDSWSDIYSSILVEAVEPRLGLERPTLFYQYPTTEAALSRPVAGDPRFAERFELYACGVELANAFGELTDPVEQRRRFVEEMDIREKVYGERYPIDEDFLAALADMPPAAGCALGFERLVVLASGASSIADVVWGEV